jgi:hypothetical protein
MFSNKSLLITCSIKYDDRVTAVVASLNIIKNNCEVLEIINCPSCASASALVSKQSIRTAIFSKLKSVVAIRLCIECDETEFNREHAEKPKLHEFEEKEKFAVSFELIESAHLVIHWKNKKAGPFWSLDFNGREQQSSDVTNIVIEFIVSALKSKQAGK